jgi:hypothetical protein
MATTTNAAMHGIILTFALVSSADSLWVVYGRRFPPTHYSQRALRLRLRLRFESLGPHGHM